MLLVDNVQLELFNEVEQNKIPRTNKDVFFT